MRTQPPTIASRVVSLLGLLVLTGVTQVLNTSAAEAPTGTSYRTTDEPCVPGVAGGETQGIHRSGDDSADLGGARRGCSTSMDEGQRR